MYRIAQKEPEGWQKAFVIYFGDVRITHCRFKDTAQECVMKMLGTN